MTPCGNTMLRIGRRRRQHLDRYLGAGQCGKRLMAMTRHAIKLHATIIRIPYKLAL
jgi:hypothetical protein